MNVSLTEALEHVDAVMHTGCFQWNALYGGDEVFQLLFGKLPAERLISTTRMKHLALTL